MGKKSKRTIQSQPKAEVEKTKKHETKIGLLWPLIALFIASFLVYSNALTNGFVYDDNWQILKNDWIKDVKFIPEIFSKGVWAFETGYSTTNYYRPFMHVVYLINYRIFGPSPWGFHLVNILFHGGVTVLVFLIALSLLRKSSPSDSKALLFPSLMAALLFMTHPIHTEVVTWVAGIPELSFTFFCLLSFYLYTESGAASRRKYVFSVVFFSIAVLCKETALAFPILLIAYDLVFGTGRRFPECLKRYIPFVAIMGIYFIARYLTLGGFAPRTLHGELTTSQYVLNVFPLFAEYLGKVVLPLKLNVFHVFHPVASVFEARVLLSLIVTAMFAVLLFLAARKSRVVLFSLLFFVVPLLPVLYIRGLGENVFAERYLYLPSMGFAILLALLLDRLKGYNKQVWHVSVAMSLALLVVYSFATISRNTVWKDDYTLFADAVEKSPDGSLPHMNLGRALQAKGRLDEAIEHYQMAIALTPNYAEAHDNLGIAFFEKGLIDKAIEEFRVTLTLAPAFAKAHSNMGGALLRKGLTDEAIEQFLIAMKLNPNFAGTYNNLGLAYTRKGLTDQAIEQFRAALKLNPDLAGAHSNLGFAYQKKGLLDQAIEQFQIALKLDPNFADAHNGLGVAFVKKGLLDEAREHFQVSVKLNPTDPDYRDNLDQTQKLISRPQTRGPGYPNAANHFQ